MADLNVYGPIGQTYDGDGMTAALWAEYTADIDPDESLTVRINSPGGSVFDGLTVYQSLADRPGDNHVVVQGVAASIASVIAMAGDTITMGQASRMMIHNPMGPSALAFGTSEDLRQAADDTNKTADLLDSIRDTLLQVYSDRTGHDSEAIRQWMTDETWISAAEAKKHGFATDIRPNKTVTAKAFTSHVVESIKNQDDLEALATLAGTIKPRKRPANLAIQASRGAYLLARAKNILAD